MSAVSFDDLSAAIGVQAALALCDEHGGTTVTVPARPKATHPISRAIGVDAAKKLNAVFGNARLSLPMGPTRGQRGRQVKVAQLLDKGFSKPEVARLADVHERTVYNIQRAAKESPAPLLDFLARKPSAS